MIGMAHVLVVYRVLAVALFSSFLEQQVTTVVVVTGAVVHYVIIVIMTKVEVRQGRPWGARLKCQGNPTWFLLPSGQQMGSPEAL